MRFKITETKPRTPNLESNPLSRPPPETHIVADGENANRLAVSSVKSNVQCSTNTSYEIHIFKG
ncbi:hypothetical protein DOY81_012120 [Sarcophaga bullata]|nr:hypothetical protein DOY81_012120 [Sarcophaga bullata]